MDETTRSQWFDEYYYAHNCGHPYERSQAWLDFFDNIAKRLIEDFQPRTVLDAGCAWGFLVERLRARGVEAYGIDISEYAIQKVHPDIQPYCWVGSITEPFPQSYDLIISIEVLEHMQPAEAERAIENFCNHTENIVFSSSPFDYKEATHFNVLQPDEWARRFARYGFFKDLDAQASAYITPWAARFYRVQGNPIQPVVQAYERKLLKLQNEVTDLRASVLEYHGKLQECTQQVQTAPAPEPAGQVPVEAYEDIKAKYEELAYRWSDLQQGRGWKMLQTIQSVRVWIFPPGSAREKLLDRLFRRSGS